MKIRRFANSLTTRLVLFGVFIVLFSGIARFYVLVDFLRDEIGATATERQGRLANYMAKGIEDGLQQRRAAIEHLASALPISLADNPAPLSSWLKEQQAMTFFPQGLFFLPADDVPLTSYPPLANSLMSSLIGSADIQRALHGATLTGQPLFLPTTRQALLPTLSPVRNAQGDVIGILGGLSAVDGSGLTSSLQQLHENGFASFILVSPTGRKLIAASDLEGLATGLPPLGNDVFLDKSLTGFRGQEIVTGTKGEDEIRATAAVPSTGWVVIASLPLSAALPPEDRSRAMIVRGGIVQSAFIALIILLAVTWFFRPLLRAADQAERMTKGELELSPLPVERRDEVGHLTMAFNRLLSRLKSNQAELQHQAHHDVLTGLPNRTMLADRMHEAIGRARRDNTGIALLFLDLDGFKPINDLYGHSAGDLVLKEIAQRLRRVARHSDTLARVGGDEFVLLATDLDMPMENGSAALAEKCIQVVSQPLKLEQGEQCLGVSIGIVVCDGKREADALLQAADQAMYSAKKKGRGCYVFAPLEESLG